MTTRRKAIMVYMDDSELELLAAVRKRYHATTNSAAIRVALAVAAEAVMERGKYRKRARDETVAR